jgi:hypothetical protein
MSRLGQLNKRLMRQIECAFQNVLLAQARLENGAAFGQGEDLAEALEMAHSFLVEAQKLAMWIDTGDVGE